MKVLQLLIKLAAGIVLVIAALAGPAHAGAPKVVVTLKPVHALAAAVMRGVGLPVLLVEGAASPHTFSLKPSGAKAVHEADILIRVSPAVEPFTNKIAEALPKSVTLLTLAEAPGVQLLDQRSGGTFEPHMREHGHDSGGHIDRDGDDGDAHGAKDGHIWLDPGNAIVIADVIAKALGEKSPENAQTYTANAAALKTRLRALQSDIASEMSPLTSKPFIVFHDATQYFERRFGLSAAGSITVSPEVGPSVKRLSAVRKKIAELGATCVFAEPGFQPNLVAAVTEGTQARSGTLDPEGILLTPGPELYFELMRALAANLKACLGPGN
jgi:zinc transport system substrate-binding protein